MPLSPLPRLLLNLACSTGAAVAAVTPSDLNGKMYTTSVTITAIGTAATLDDATSPLGAPTAFRAITNSQ